MNIYGHTPNMVDIDTRTVLQGRYFTDAENERSAQVCLIGDSLVQNFFAGTTRWAKVFAWREEYMVIGTFEKIGSVLGQDQDNFAMVPMNQFFRLRPRFSLTLNVLTKAGEKNFERAQDEVTVILRARVTSVPEPKTTSSSARRTATSRFGNRSAERFSRFS